MAAVGLGCGPYVDDYICAGNLIHDICHHDTRSVVTRRMNCDVTFFTFGELAYSLECFPDFWCNRTLLANEKRMILEKVMSSCVAFKANMTDRLW